MRISVWSSDVCSSDLGFLSTIHAILHSCAQATVARRLCAVKSQGGRNRPCRSEEHTSELQSLMRISYAVFCLKKKINIITTSTQSTDGKQNRTRSHTTHNITQQDHQQQKTYNKTHSH